MDTHRGARVLAHVMTAIYLFFYLMNGWEVSHEALSPPHDTWAECQISRSLYEWKGSATSECFALIKLDSHDTVGAAVHP